MAEEENLEQAAVRDSGNEAKPDNEQAPADVTLDDAVVRRLERFKRDLFKLNSQDVVRKHILSDDCYLLNPDYFFDLRSEVATEFAVHSLNVKMVGSAKLGFSIKPAQDRQRQENPLFQTS